MFTKNKFAQMDSISNLINTILETDTKAKMEELKGNQHKIDKNKNNKIDAHDFKILRGEKKVEESSHQAKTTMKHVKNPTAGEKAAAKDIKPGVAGYRDRIAMLKSAEARGGLKKEEVEQIDEIGDTPAGKQMLGRYIKKSARRVGVHASVASQYADTAGSETATPSQRRAASTLALNQKHKRDMRLRGVERATDRMTKEETEQVDEAKEPGFRASYGLGRKGTAAKKPETYGKRVTGKGYDKPENERKAPEGNVAMTSMMPGHDERAAKFLARQAKGTLVKGKAQSAKQMEKEEIDPKKTMTDTLKGREKDSSNPFLSKKVMMDVPDNVKEQQGVAEVWKGHSSTVKNPNFNDELSYRRVNPVGKRLKSGKLSADERGSQERTKALIKYTQKRGGLAGPKGPLPEETEHINERTLTEPETTEKERIVKGMKKSLAGFKSRYGDRAKSVMYATATKAAKERK